MTVGGPNTTTQIGTLSLCSGIPVTSTQTAPTVSCGAVAPVAAFTTVYPAVAHVFFINAAPGPGDTLNTLDATPVLVAVQSSSFLTNVVTTTTYAIDQITATTYTTTQFEQWTLFGTVQAFGIVHTAAQSGALDANSRFLRRLGDGAGRGDETSYHTWLEGYGMWSRAEPQGGISGDTRNLYGIAAGFSADVSPNFTLGAGIDHGNTDITLDKAFAESGRIDLTQIGVNAGFTSGAWFANLAATYGFGSVDTNHAIGGVSTASYGIITSGALAETGYRFDLDGLNVTPSVGLDFTDVRSDGFTETGGLALTASSYSADRTRIWAGLNIGQHFGDFDWSVYGRLVGVISGDERLLPVTFGNTPMAVTGNPDAKIGADAGARVSYKLAQGGELIARYDGRFRDGFTAHSARVGVKVSF